MLIFFIKKNLEPLDFTKLWNTFDLTNHLKNFKHLLII
jgi:hypothetical protein